jgi:uncharacterized protein (TIGR03437 family)
MKRKTTLLVLLLGACAGQSFAQIGFESSGDALLNGTYYMRQVIYFVSQETIAETMNVQGTITFDGNGGYSFNGSLVSTASTPPAQSLVTSGSYVISASGEGYISTVNSSSFPTDRIVGLVSHGVFIGSTTQTPFGYNDLFIAAPIGSAEATNASLNGQYSMAYFDPTYPGDALLTMTSDGQGHIGTVNVNAYTGANTTAATQSITGVTYAFSNGAAQLKLGGTRNTSTFIAGTELLYISPDGNFIFGGSSGGYDMFVGVRAATSKPSNFPGLYYQAGLGLDEAAVNSGASSVLDSYYGSFNALSGQIFGHQSMGSAAPIKFQSLNSLLTYGGSGDFTYSDSYTLNDDGSSDDTAFAQHYVSSTDGTVRIGYGIGPFLSLNVAFQEPAFSASGVYLNPAGVVNAASSAPFTAHVSPGEFLTLYGSGLALSTASANVPFPQMLNNVQVLIDNVAAPISYVSPTLIEVIVPYGTDTETAAQIQVLNNGVSSNLVTDLSGSTSVGVFTNNPVGGSGYAAALHLDYSLVSKSSPAHVGETVAVYLTGMGAVSPSVGDGAAAPSNPLSYTTANPLVYILDSAGHYLQATPIIFSGLAPGYAGLYQINLTIPSGLVSGDAFLEIVGTDSGTFQALLPLTTSTATASAK